MELIEERRRILLDTPHIETISTSAFKTDMIAPFKKLEARFEAEQSGSGDPSPDNVRPIEGRTDMVVRHIGKNLFDKGNPLVKNKYVSADGSITTSSAYQYSDYYTMVQPNTNYVFSGIIAITNAYNTISFYDNSKTFIGRHVPPKGKTGANFTTPSNCSYIRFNLGMDADLDTIQLEVGSEATEYESYTEPYYPLGKNLANPDTIIKGGYYSGSGAWSANTVSATTGLIRVKPNTTYVSSIFDNAGTRLNACVATLWNDATTCTGQITTQKFTTGSQTQFVRIRNFDAQGSYITNDDFKFQLEEAEVPTAFEEYKGTGYIVNWGKNLFDQSLMKDQTAWNIIKIYAPVGTKLIMSTNQPPPAQSGLLTYFMYNGGQQSINENCYINHPVSRIVPEIGYVQVAQRNRDYISSVDDWNYQIEIGSEASEYQPYVSEVYGGTLDLTTGILTVTHKTLQANWRTPATTDTKNRWVIGMRIDDALSEMRGKMWNATTDYYSACDRLEKKIEANAQEGEATFALYGHSSYVEWRVRIPNTYTAEEAKAIADASTLCYLCEPYTIQLTPQQILTLKRYNTLMPEGTINEIKYWTHI